jgi:hypothetical protein
MNRVVEVLRALQEERRSLVIELSRIDRAIAALEVALEPGELPPPQLPVTGAAVPPPKAESQPYAMLKFYEAAADYLASVQEPKTVREIADALVAGGFRTRSKNFASSVRTMLGRMIRNSEGMEQGPDRRWRFVGYPPD